MSKKLISAAPKEYGFSDNYAPALEKFSNTLEAAVEQLKADIDNTPESKPEDREHILKAVLDLIALNYWPLWGHAVINDKAWALEHLELFAQQTVKVVQTSQHPVIQLFQAMGAPPEVLSKLYTKLGEAA